MIHNDDEMIAFCEYLSNWFKKTEKISRFTLWCGADKDSVIDAIKGNFRRDIEEFNKTPFRTGNWFDYDKKDNDTTQQDKEMKTQKDTAIADALATTYDCIDDLQKLCKYPKETVVLMVLFLRHEAKELHILKTQISSGDLDFLKRVRQLPKHRKNMFIEYIMREAGINTPVVENRKETKMIHVECDCEKQTTEMKYKIGDKVYIKPWNLMAEQYGLTEDGTKIKCVGGFTTDMEQTIKHTNRVVVITKIVGDAYRGTYSDGINFPFFITDDMIRSYAFEYGDNCYDEKGNSYTFLYYYIGEHTSSGIVCRDSFGSTLRALRLTPYAPIKKTEVTLEQIAEKFGCAVSDLIIKETK